MRRLLVCGSSHGPFSRFVGRKCQQRRLSRIREAVSLEELGLGLRDDGNIVCVQLGLSPIVSRLGGGSQEVGHSRWMGACAGRLN